MSGLEKIDTNQKVWRPKAIYHYIQFNNLNPDFIILNLGGGVQEILGLYLKKNFLKIWFCEEKNGTLLKKTAF